ncbi:RNA dependent RNA polymerase-domain-containing protein [Amylocystis lapponica]|nr:RNA dependent RNA polymerase-domain-containing protein [Amylocystis lapponica]
MEIYMTNIGYTVSSSSLKLHLASILHGPDYAHYSHSPLNFEVRIFPRRRGQGALTVPTEEVGAHFLREFGGASPRRSVVINTRIRFQKSRNNPNREVLETIRRLAYTDPRVRLEREDRETESITRTVSIRTLQFGWECRDGVYSVEWEKNCAKAELIFDEDRREFRIKLYDLLEVRRIAIHVAQIFWSSSSVDHNDVPAIFLSLNHPPSFETEPLGDLSEMLTSLLSLSKSRNIPLRHKLSALSDDHAGVAPFTSLAIRLVCNSPTDLENFRWYSHVARTRPSDFCYSVEHRGLFSESVRSAYDAWVARLDWCVAFQVEALARSFVADLTELLGLRPAIERVVTANGPAFAAAFLRDFASQAKAEVWYTDDTQGPAPSIHSIFDRSLHDFRPVVPPAILPQMASETFECLHLTVTPTMISLEGPFPERLNRVMRKYTGHHDSFLRVNFVDENRLQYRFDREVDGRGFINRRVKGLLLNGIMIAGRYFSFLAYSQSALKEHAVWFVKPFLHPDLGRIDAPAIIQDLGSFQDLVFDRRLIYCPARYGARISQSFTATDASISVEVEEVLMLPDIEDAEGRCFTDGVGTISRELARAVWTELRARRRRARRAKTYPRELQIRFMGSKGMLSVDYKLSGREICLRPSMIKFEAPHSLEIEIARAFDRPGKYYLNRPLIMLLEGLGVPYEVFKSLQDDAVEDAQNSVLSLERAARMLEAYGLGASYRLTSTMLSLGKLGVGPLTEDMFWKQMMDFAINHVLRELKHHARIHVPDGWTLVGVADVHEYLQEGEIFACIDSPDRHELVYLEGPTLISRSPTIHPGDVQVVRAIGRPPCGSPFEHESLRNSVVFSVKGERPLPSCLGGGDLDGDVYNLTTMESMLPPRSYHAASYTPAKRKEVPYPSTMDDVAEFVAEYISSDTLGIIAITWLIIADQSDQGILDPDCLLLAQLHSDAVDYPKTGNPVPIERIPRLKFPAKPDWNAPETLTREAKSFYESSRAIGRLFRAIDLPALEPAAQASRLQRRQMANAADFTGFDDILDEFRAIEPHYNDYLELLIQQRVSQFIDIPDYEDDAIARVWELYQSYVSQLRAICADHTLSRARSAMLTEEEAVVGTIVAKCSQPRKRKDLMSQLREQTTLLVKGIQAEISGDDETAVEQSLEQAWIAYRLALIEGDSFGARSFAWVALGEIFDAIKEIEEADRLL